MPVVLKVYEAYTRDVGRGVIRTDYDTMDSLAASTGDIVEIKSQTGGKTTFAKCLPLYPSDEHKNVARFDVYVRNNAGVAIDDNVELRKVKPFIASVIAVAPMEPIPPVGEKYLADALESVVVKIGDTVMVPFFGGRLSFRVASIDPAPNTEYEAASVTQSTRFIILSMVGTYPIALNFKDTVRQLEEGPDADNNVAMLLFIEFELEFSLTEVGRYERKLVLPRDKVAGKLAAAVNKFYDIAVRIAREEGDKSLDKMVSSGMSEKHGTGIREALRQVKYRIIEEWTNVQL